MIELGKYQTLYVARFVDFGAYLRPKDSEREVLLPARYMPENLEQGSPIEVFVYNDSEDRLVATTEKPYATVGEFAFLQVTAVNKVGAFIDWGLPKDLLVPFGEQKFKMRTGGIYLVYIYVDDATSRIVASARIERFLDNVYPDFKPGDKVEALIYEHSPIGYKAIVNNRHRGMLYSNELYRPIEIEESTTAYVKNVRPDGKIDLTLRADARSRTESLTDVILHYLAKPGAMPIGDSLSPEQVQLLFNCSKKDFKKALGSLYRQKKITISSDGVASLV